MAKLMVALLALGCICLLATAARQNWKAHSGEASLSDAAQKAIVLAIEDEIYDWGCQKDFEFVGTSSSNGHEVRVYINPQLSDGRGEIIYKLMPFGEVYRSFSIVMDGMASLDDTPQQGFGPERPNYKTVYMDDDELVKDKEQWTRSIFVISEHPTKDRLDEARARQHERLGKTDYGPHKNCPL